MNIKKLFMKPLDYIKTIFIDGLLTILPITITIALFVFFFRLLKKWLAPIHLIQPKFLYGVPHAEIMLVLLLVLLIGAIFRTFFIKRFLHLIESVFFKIPLMNPVYSGIKQLVQAFRPDNLTFKKVVLVEFPRPGVYSIGFLTSEVPEKITPKQEKKFFNIYIPTTPNPTTGFLILVPEHEFIIVDLTRQEAMSLIISGGIIQPDRFIKQ